MFLQRRYIKPVASFVPSDIPGAVLWSEAQGEADFVGYNAGAFTEWVNRISGSPNLLNSAATPFVWNGTKKQVEAAPGLLYRPFADYFTGIEYTVVVLVEGSDISSGARNTFGFSRTGTGYDYHWLSDMTYNSAPQVRFQSSETGGTGTYVLYTSLTNTIGERHVTAVRASESLNTLKINTNSLVNNAALNHRPPLNQLSLGTIVRSSSNLPNPTYCAAVFAANRFLTDEELAEVTNYFNQLI